MWWLDRRKGQYVCQIVIYADETTEPVTHARQRTVLAHAICPCSTAVVKNTYVKPAQLHMSSSECKDSNLLC